MRRTRRLPVETPEINFVPMLDMVALLIQMLLINAQFGSYAQVPSMVGTPVDQVSAGLHLLVQVTGDGYVVSWSEGEVRRTESVPCAAIGCVTPESYDREGLRRLARDLKALHPEETQGLLVPSEAVSFEAVIGAMDALRSGVAPSDGSEVPKQEPLFPDIVLTQGAP